MEIIRFHKRALVIADASMRETLALADKAARTDAPVLIIGESGTGKELIARYIHERSNRSTAPYVSVNCAAIPEGLMEAELFGHERGAFTGAITSRVGKFERATRGTLLLDEVSEMSVNLQAKLLRVLQEGEVDRLGGRETIPVETRIVATTNLDPIDLIRRGRFRKDLYYRLNVIRIRCAPLRGRMEAILALAEEFSRQAAVRLGAREPEILPDARELLTRYGWPGNVRELQNCMERAVLLSDNGRITCREIELCGGLLEADASPELAPLSEMERRHILEALRRTGGNRTEAARNLGITVRTLRNKLKSYGSEAGESGE